MPARSAIVRGGNGEPVFVMMEAKVFTVAHVRDEEVNSTGCPEGETICGMPLEPAEIWMPITLRPGDRVCPFCADPARAGGEGEQGMLL